MKAASRTPLQALVYHTRNVLWLRRLVDGLWYGACVGAMILFLTGIVHLYLSPVSILTWSLVGLAPLLLVAMRVWLWQRPSCATAANELDRWGGYDNLLASAWEVQSTPRDDRSGGGNVVLQQAIALSTEIRLPIKLVSASCWHGRFSALPWCILAIAVFLLQLPTRENVDAAGSVASIDYSIAGDGGFTSTAMATPENPRKHLEPATAVPMTDLGDNAPGQDNREMSEKLESEGLEDQDSIADVATQGVEKVIMDRAMAGNTIPENRVPAGTGDNKSARELEKQYESIARETPSTGQQIIAGTGGSKFAAMNAGAMDTLWPDNLEVVVRPGSAPYSNRFSLAQRLKIRSYFSHLEE